MKSHRANGPVAILRDCLVTLRGACGGPLEQGGLLLGTRSRSGSLIYDARPLSGALRTPRAFHPRRWRPPPGLRRDVVGWFHTHPTGGLHLSRADARVHRHLFPRGEGLALVVGRAQLPPSRPATPAFRYVNGGGHGPLFDLALYGGSPLRAVEALQVL